MINVRYINSRTETYIIVSIIYQIIYLCISIFWFTVFSYDLLNTKLIGKNINIFSELGIDICVWNYISFTKFRSDEFGHLLIFISMFPLKFFHQ